MNISTSKILQADFKSHKDQQAFAKTFVKTTFVTQWPFHKECIHFTYKNKKKTFSIKMRRCRDIKTQKACKQGQEANIGPKIKQTTSL